MYPVRYGVYVSQACRLWLCKTIVWWLHLSFCDTVQVGHGAGLPDSPPPDYESNEEFLKAAHHVMLEVCAAEEWKRDHDNIHASIRFLFHVSLLVRFATGICVGGTFV